MLTKKQIKHLRSLAQTYKAVVQVGKYGITPGTLQTIDENLKLNELTKIHLLNNTEMDPKETAQELARTTGSEIVQVIGRRIILFRKNDEKSVIELPD